MDRVANLLAALCLSAACCDGGSPGERDGGAETDAGGATDPIGEARQAKVPPVVHTYEPTFSAIDREILVPTCALVFCHGGEDLYVDFTSREMAYASLVGVAAEGDGCPDMLRVAPGAPADSLLLLKLTEPPCGERMPLGIGVSAMLPPPEIEQIRAWIERGAPED